MDDLVARRDALRQSATAPGADLTTLLDAALTELDGVIAVMGDGPGGPSPDGAADSLRTERGLLRAAFQQAPAALFLLAADGTIRRASDRAVALLGARTGYATGKPLTVFVDPPQRAEVQTKLAAVARTGQAGTIPCRLVTPGGITKVTLALTALELPGETPVLAASLSPQAGGAVEEDHRPALDKAEDRRGLAALARRLDTVVALTRLLLDNTTFSEAATIQRCARLLAGELADWVIVDVARDGGLRRQVAAGPRGPAGEEPARVARGTDPAPGTLPAQVHAARKSVLLAHADDLAALGTAPDGTPLLMALRATSLLVVPVADGDVCYGTLTLARFASSGSFTLAEQALAEDIAGHLAVSLRVDRVFRRCSETAEALQASLLPERLPEVAGLDLASASINATRWQEVSGDFYDVFRTPHGWAATIGDVSGIGQAAAAMTAAARHSVRALAYARQDPAEVLATASEALLAGDYGERFVTAMLAFFEKRANGGYRVRLGNAGHVGPAVVRADGRVEIVSGCTLPLGLLPDDTGGECSVLDLDPGDLLFFYTNGVTQACTQDWDFFEDRLADTLAATAGSTATEVVRAVTGQLTDFCHEDFRDDVAVLAMRVR